MRTNIPEKEHSNIEEMIGSEESVVGIDAKKTHIVIIYMLQEMNKSIEKLDKRLETLEQKVQ
ncbi:hypothetical protein [Gracilimonas sp.]|uniref:hypothetical protein n=1 Tax=Gracilimonas sp. TaxID=1974203 RepID=UPI0028717C3F|nr:hypothetical protein [Gracilimonas sp.]